MVSAWTALALICVVVGLLSVASATTTTPTHTHEGIVNGTRKHKKHERVEVVIPADPRLETLEVSENIEEELGHAKLGRNSAKRKFVRVRKLREKKDTVGEKTKRNILKDLDEKFEKVEKEFDDPGLVVTEDSRTDFSTEIVDVDGNVIDEEVHTHHLRKVGNVLIPHREEQNVEISSGGEDSGGSSLISKSVVDKMIRLRHLLDEAIDHFHSFDGVESNTIDDLDSTGHVNLVREALKEVSKDKRFILRKRRDDNPDDRPVQNCIYVDIPGGEPQTEVEPYFLDSDNNTNYNNYGMEGDYNNQYYNQSDDNYHIHEKIEYDTQYNNEYADQESASTNQQETTSNMNPIYWLHIPPEEIIPNKEMFQELVDVVGAFHKAGKDLLFVPVKKTYADYENEKQSFLKGLQVNSLDKDENNQSMSQ